MLQQSPVNATPVHRRPAGIRTTQVAPRILPARRGSLNRVRQRSAGVAAGTGQPALSDHATPPQPPPRQRRHENRYVIQR